MLCIVCLTSMSCVHLKMRWLRCLDHKTVWWNVFKSTQRLFCTIYHTTRRYLKDIPSSAWWMGGLGYMRLQNHQWRTAASTELPSIFLKISLCRLDHQQSYWSMIFSISEVPQMSFPAASLFSFSVAQYLRGRFWKSTKRICPLWLKNIPEKCTSTLTGCHVCSAADIDKSMTAKSKITEVFHVLV